MSVNLTINGVVYAYPETDAVDWGPDATDWAAAVTTGMLQKAGGTFQLLAEVDFGTAFGIKSLYYKTRTANPADAGPFRLARTDVINWRNQANNANLSLSVDASDNLFFNGTPVVGSVTVNDSDSIDLDLTGSVLTADLNLSAAAAGVGFYNSVASIESDGLQVQTSIADTSTTGVLTSADWNTFNGKQASGNYITALTGDVVATGPGSVAAAIQPGVIVNSMVSASAAIDFSKLASLTSANILVGSAGNVATSVAMTGDISITNAGLTAYSGTVPLNKGGTGQTTKAAAFDALSPMSASGDIIYGGTAGTGTKLVKGSDGQKLSLVSGLPAWTSGNANLGYSNQTTTYSILTTDDVLTFSGASFTATLPTAAGVTGKTYQLQHAGTSLTQVYTLATTSSQTIGGVAGGSYVLRTNGETLNLMSDGSNWLILAHKTITATSSTFAATPSAGFGTVTGSVILGWRVGDEIHIRGSFTGGTVAASTASLALPVAIDTAKIQTGSAIQKLGTWIQAVSAATSVITNAISGDLFFDGSDAGNVYFATAVGSKVFTKFNVSSVASSTVPFSFQLSYPAAGFQP